MKGPDIVTDLQCCHGKCKKNALSPIYLSVLKVKIIQIFKHLHRMPRGTPQGGEEKDQKFQPIYSNVWVQEQDVHSQFSQFHRG